jgi:hypothetical protein
MCEPHTTRTQLVYRFEPSTGEKQNYSSQLQINRKEVLPSSRGLLKSIRKVSRTPRENIGREKKLHQEAKTRREKILLVAVCTNYSVLALFSLHPLARFLVCLP